MSATRLFLPPKPTVRAAPGIPGEVSFAAGLQPFDGAHIFKLRADESFAPFLRMDCAETDLSFVMISPFAIMESYAPEFFDTDLAELELTPEDHPLVLSIVNMSRGIADATTNLAGPLLINARTGKGKQVVLVNAHRYQVRHRLLS